MYIKNKTYEKRDVNLKVQMGKNKHTDFLKKYVPGIIFVCMVFLLVFGNPALARDKSVFNVDLYFGWGGYFRPMEWTPLEVTANNTLEKPFNGELTISSQQDGLNTLNIVIHDFVLTPNATEYKPLVTKIAFTNQKCNLKIDQVDGKRRKTVLTQEHNVMMTQGRIPVVNEYDMLIGVVGAGKYGLLRMEKQTQSVFKNVSGNVYVGTKQSDMVPWDWTGYVSLDLLILYNPDWKLLKEPQLKAIAQWVSNGGKILLVLGSNPPRGSDPLTDMIPFDYLEAKEAEISIPQLLEWNLSSYGPEKVSLRPIVKKQNAHFCEGDIYQDDQYLFAVGNVGFGKVGVLGFDPEDFSTSQDIHSSVFWTNLIKSILKSDSSANNTILAQRQIQYAPSDDNQPYGAGMVGGRPTRAIQQGNRNYYDIGSAYSLNNKVMEFLYQEIKPLSVWFVILLLGALAVLLGPIDYKFLKTIDRLPLTWLTCTFWIIAFTVGAYYGVQYIRGGKMQLRVVSVIDGVKGDNIAWATDYSGLFASKSDSYELENLKTDQWWSGIAPTQEQLYAYSSEIGSRRIYCTQENGGNLPESLPVNIWDIQCMLTESPVEKMPFTAEVKQEGDDVVILTINNESDSPITSGYMMVSKQRGISFDQVPAHSVKEFRRNISSLRNWDRNIGDFTSVSQYRGTNYGGFRDEAAYFAQGCLQRTMAINNYLSKGAYVVCVTYGDAPVSFGVKDHSISEEHIQLARLVIFPNLEGTGNDRN